MTASDVRICFIGDSLLQGTGDPACLGWPGRLLQHLNRDGFVATGYNLGIRRETSEDIKQRWQTEAERRLPDHSDNYLVFAFGVNDTSLVNGNPRVSQASSVNNLQQILGESAVCYPTLMVGPTPVGDAAQSDRIAELDRAFEAAASEFAVPYLSVFDALTLSGVWTNEIRAGDGSHPGEGGYQLLSKLIANSPAWWFRKG